MIRLLLALLLGVVAPRHAEAVLWTAPGPISLPDAREHAAAAVVAGACHRVDDALLLAIAARESGYLDTREVAAADRGHRGVSGPRPTVLGSYLALAAHVRAWLDARDRGPGHRRLTVAEAITGVAGGYALVEACRAGPVLVPLRGGPFDACDTAPMLLARAREIREIREARP